MKLLLFFFWPFSVCRRFHTGNYKYCTKYTCHSVFLFLTWLQTIAWEKKKHTHKYHLTHIHVHIASSLRSATRAISQQQPGNHHKIAHMLSIQEQPRNHHYSSVNFPNVSMCSLYSSYCFRFDMRASVQLQWLHYEIWSFIRRINPWHN